MITILVDPESYAVFALGEDTQCQMAGEAPDVGDTVVVLCADPGYMPLRFDVADIWHNAFGPVCDLTNFHGAGHG